MKNTEMHSDSLVSLEVFSIVKKLWGKIWKIPEEVK